MRIFSLLAIFFVAATLCAQRVINWEELNFLRPGVGYDMSDKVYAANEPVMEDGGIRLMSGGEDSGEVAVNIVPSGEEWAEGKEFTGIARSSEITHPQGGMLVGAFEAKGSGKLMVKPADSGPITTFELAPEYRRYILPGVNFPKNQPGTVKFEFNTDGSANVRRLQVEQSTSSMRPACAAWIPPGEQRRYEELVVPPILQQLLSDHNFTLSFKFKVTVPCNSNVIFEQTVRGRWWPNLQLSANAHQFLLKTFDTAIGKERTVKTSVKFKANTIYEAKITRQGGKAEVWIDGQSAGVIENLETPAIKTMKIGGGGPGCSLNGILYRVTADSLPSAASVEVIPASYIRHLARSRGASIYRFKLVNHSREEQQNLTLKWQVDNLVFLRKNLEIPAGSSIIAEQKIMLPLPPGNYRQNLILSNGDKILHRLELPVTVTPAPEPLENLQISPWFQFVPGKGFTMGHAPTCGEAMAAGLHYGPFQWRYRGFPRGYHPEDLIISPRKSPIFADFIYSDYMREQRAKVIASEVASLAFYPALSHVDVNNEINWNSQLNLSAPVLEAAKKDFGLDLSPWLVPSKAEMVLPVGRLTLKNGLCPVPENKIIPDNDPFYNWHRTYKNTTGNTASEHNQYMMRAIKAERADIQTVFAPILRQSPLRTYGEPLDIAQNWCYTFGLGVVAVQERLTGMTRGRDHMKSSSFPAFLTRDVGEKIKSRPTADIFRASTWASLLRPSSMLAFFQAAEMFKEKTPAGLDSAVEKFLKEELRPFGALIPQWQNRPRRVAVYFSFANQLFSGVRWPQDYPPEVEALVTAGTPFDILYDDDFLENPAILHQYRLLVVPDMQFALQCAASAIEDFSQQPGRILISNPQLLPKAIAMPSATAGDTAAQLQKITGELNRKYGDDPAKPAYAEAMEEALAELGRTAPDNWMREKVAAIKPEAFSRFASSYLNILSLDQCNFLGIVNDLRTRQYWKIPEQGVPQSGSIEFSSGLGKYAYDLMTSKPLEIIPMEKDYGKLHFLLPGGEAKIILLSPTPAGKLTGTVSEQNGVIRCTANLGGKISVPAFVTVENAPDYSGSALFRNGELVYEFPAEQSIREIIIKELATGQTIRLEVK